MDKKKSAISPGGWILWLIVVFFVGFILVVVLHEATGVMRSTLFIPWFLALGWIYHKYKEAKKWSRPCGKP